MNGMIVEIKNFENYGTFAKKYGIVQQIMDYTIVVNFDSKNGSGICINIAQEDVKLINQDRFMEYANIIYEKQRDKLVDTGLKVN